MSLFDHMNIRNFPSTLERTKAITHANRGETIYVIFIHLISKVTRLGLFNKDKVTILVRGERF